MDKKCKCYSCNGTGFVLLENLMYWCPRCRCTGEIDWIDNLFREDVTFEEIQQVWGGIYPKGFNSAKYTTNNIKVLTYPIYSIYGQQPSHYELVEYPLISPVTTNKNTE